QALGHAPGPRAPLLLGLGAQAAQLEAPLQTTPHGSHGARQRARQPTAIRGARRPRGRAGRGVPSLSPAARFAGRASPLLLPSRLSAARTGNHGSARNPSWHTARAKPRPLANSGGWVANCLAWPSECYNRVSSTRLAPAGRWARAR